MFPNIYALKILTNQPSTYDCLELKRCITIEALISEDPRRKPVLLLKIAEMFVAITRASSGYSAHGIPRTICQ